MCILVALGHIFTLYIQIRPKSIKSLTVIRENVLADITKLSETLAIVFNSV